MGDLGSADVNSCVGAKSVVGTSALGVVEGEANRLRRGVRGVGVSNGLVARMVFSS